MSSSSMTQPAESASAEKYFEELMPRQSHRKSVESIMRQKEDNLESGIQDGSVPVNPEQNVINATHKHQERNLSESREKAFNIDRSRIEERYLALKKLRQEYSHENTALVVKQVESKIREWAEKKQEVQRKVKRSKDSEAQRERALREQTIQLEQEKLAEERERKRKEIENRIHKMEEVNRERKNRAKEVLGNTVSPPKYLQYEKKLEEVESSLMEERDRIHRMRLEEQKFDREELRQHERQYLREKKEKDEARKNSLSISFTKQNRDKPVPKATQFCLLLKDDEQQKEIDRIKRKRRLQFIENVKQTIGKPKQQKREVEGVNEEELSLRKLKHVRNIDADPRELGNQYLKALKVHDKQMNRRKASSFSSLPSIKPSYKNYLGEVKIVRKKPYDQIEELKKNCRSPAEIFSALNMKSQIYEESMMKKIGELKRINKYEDSVSKESEIDDLFTRSLKMRLASINP